MLSWREEINRISTFSKGIMRNPTLFWISARVTVCICNDNNSNTTGASKTIETEDSIFCKFKILNENMSTVE